MRVSSSLLLLCSQVLFLGAANAVTLPKNVPIPIPRPDQKLTTPASKTTVCSITINSSDEIEMFKASLPAATTNFVELTKLTDDKLEGDREAEETTDEPQDSGKSAWLRKACQQKIKCDVLVISGHFGGSFFGSSGLDLSMETLEELSCDKGCDGILQNPKEVFLMGCNTLAGKKQDHRSPEEYRRVLRQDGFSAEQAEQVVAFRYSPLGDAFSDRMRRVFRGAPRIYGFDSVGPSGKNVRGLLGNYFKSLKGTNYYLPENLRKLDEATNGKLATALKVTAFAQESGAKEMQREQIPTCYLNNSKVPFNAKLHWITNSLRSEKSFAYLPAINDWLSRLTVDNYQWKDKEFEILEPVMTNSKLRDSLAGIVARRDSAILGMQLKVLTFMKFFGWVYNKDYMKKVEALLIGDMNQAFDLERKDQICSYASSNSIKVSFSTADIPAARFQDAHFVRALSCVANFDEDLMVRALREYLKADAKSDIGQAYLAYLQQLKVPGNAHASYFRTLMPNGDRGLNEHQTKLLCSSSYYSKHPMWERPELNPELIAQPEYIKNTGCYLKFNKRVFDQLMQLSRGDSDSRSAVIEALDRQRQFATEMNIDDSAQEALLDLMQGSSVEDQQRLAGIWQLVKNLTPNVQNRMKAELYKLAKQPLSVNATTLEGIIASALKPEVYCEFALERAETALDAGHWDTGMNAMDSMASRCMRKLPDSEEYGYLPGEKARLLRTIPKLYAQLAKHDYDKISEQMMDLGIMPVDLMGQIIELKIPIQNLKEARALTAMNSRTYQGRMGYVASDSTIFGLYPLAKLVPETLKLKASKNAEDVRLAYQILRAVDLENDAVTAELAKEALAQGLKMLENDEKIPLRALGRQDLNKGVQVWFESYIKAKPDEKSYPVGFTGLMSMENSPLIAHVKARLKAKTVSESVVAEFLQTYASNARAYYQFNELRALLRQFAQEFPTAKIQEGTRAALRIVQEREAECEESPRMCRYEEEE